MNFPYFSINKVSVLLDKLDKNNDGKIDANELVAILKQSKTCHADAQRFINEYDLDDDGCLNKEEFLEFVKSRR